MKNHKKKWTKDEKKFIKKNYGKISVSEIASKLHRTYRAVQQMAQNMNIRSRERNEWTEDEILILKKNYHKYTTDQLSETMLKAHHVDNIRKKAKEIGVANKNWSKQEVDYLRKNFNKKSLSEISSVINRTEVAVKRKAYRLKL